MSLTIKFFERCARTNIHASEQEEEERYEFPPKLGYYVNWWQVWKDWNKRRKDGLDDHNPYG